MIPVNGTSEELLADEVFWNKNNFITLQNGLHGTEDNAKQEPMIEKALFESINNTKDFSSKKEEFSKRDTGLSSHFKDLHLLAFSK